jgi:hypothetical protein
MAPIVPPARPVGSHAWFFLVAAAVLFVLAAFAFGGDTLSGIPGLTWVCGGIAAIILAWVVP